MNSVTVELPDSLKKQIEALAAAEGSTVSQFLASAAGEKLAVVMTMDYLRREAAAGRRENLESIWRPYQTLIRYRKIAQRRSDGRRRRNARV